jgi:tRNA (cmo5U34)-methyltransferase
VRDRVFDQTGRHLFERFEFDDVVASVFDDMVRRSVPCYSIIQDLIADLAVRLHGGRPIYDLGCSTGSTFEAIIKRTTQPLVLVGVDNSVAMLEACRAKLQPQLGASVLHCERLALEELNCLERGPAGVVIVCLTVQFLRPAMRLDFLRTVFRNIAPGGALLMVEKTIEQDIELNSLFLEQYHAFKTSMGYSMVEIARKREALENRLIPFYPQENLDLLKAAGFTKITTFFAWMNFQGYLAVRSTCPFGARA